MTNSVAAPATQRTPDALADTWRQLREEHPRIRIRDAADRMGVSEMELLATECGTTVRRLVCDINALLPRLESLGEVMALTRNELFVIESTGVYENPGIGGHASQIVGSEIDLRIFPRAWKHAFAVEMETSRGPLHSLQFFDAYGDALHKLYLQEASNREVYDALVEELTHEDQSRAVEVEERPAPAAPRPDSEVDVEALEEGWRAMFDTHDFFGLLRKHQVTRTQALRLVSDDLARPARPEALETILRTASEDGIEIMVFVGNDGMIQIHHGPVNRIVARDEWMNVMDPRLNIHARPGEVDQVWVVRKPTDTGWVTSVEFYDQAGSPACILFGYRKEGEEENPAWRALAEGLPR